MNIVSNNFRENSIINKVEKSLGYFQIYELEE